MIAMSLSEIAEVVGGVANGMALVSGEAFVDTREPVSGGLFVAIAGERVDGHDFADRAFQAGAAAVLGTRATSGPTVVVEDVVTALGTLARHVLAQLHDITVFALTGSQGKTGVKDYLAQILQDLGPTVATAGNLNNEIGVPLTVLRVTPQTRNLVVEMGARGIGHIAYLCTIAPPDVAAVLNVGTAHVGEFGSREAIACAKAEIVQALTASGTAVLNLGDPMVAAMAAETSAEVLTWGPLELGPTLGFSEVVADELQRHRMRLTWSSDLVAAASVSLRELGFHQVLNATAAAAMACAAGAGLESVARSLSQAQSRSRWRMEIGERGDGLLVINDSYNANPESMQAAIETLGAIGARSRRRTIAVLGEMFELGEETTAGHGAVGEYAARAGIDIVVTVGAAARAIAAAYATGDNCGEAIVTASRDEAIDWLRQNVAAADVVLVKASRGAALESVAEQLIAQPNNEGTRTS